MTMAITMELLAQDAAAVRIAREIGAERVELCQALALGGLTPSIATIEQAVATASGEVEVHVLVRARPGGFRYSSGEFDVMVNDVRAAMAAGAAGVVVGCLDEAGGFDIAGMRRLRDAAGHGSVAVHRAIDVCADPFAALDELVSLGVTRVLTSGAASTAVEGAEMIRALVAHAEDEIAVMAGSGVTADNIPLVLATGVRDVHFSAKRAVPDTSGVSMGYATAEGVGPYDIVDVDVARAIAAAVQHFSAAQGGAPA
ncbi:hypothetical protein ASD65_08595 [Microbacterium sp. Root61]|nr:hypothetical protein ASD65_08595 [Microbacterium sp. Root61]